MRADADAWREQFLRQVQDAAQAAPLKQASLAADLTTWTRLTTAAVVRSCESLDWQAAARGHRSTRLPESGEEYLALDVCAFASEPSAGSAHRKWPFPVAVFELENSPRDDRVAYSLWKVLCIRAGLRVVFAYRRDWNAARALMAALTENLVRDITPEERVALGGETLVVTGSRGEGETFPYGYFKFWSLDTNLGRFERR